MNFRMSLEEIKAMQEPEKYDQRFIEHGINLESSEHIGWRIQKARVDLFYSVSQEKREAILKTIKQGKTLGEVAKMHDVSVDLVSEVLYFNIQETSLLRSTSI